MNLSPLFEAHAIDTDLAGQGELWTWTTPLEGGVRRLDREVADWNLSETRVLWPFRKGRNRLLFKLHNGLGTMFVSVVLSPP